MCIVKIEQGQRSYGNLRNDGTLWQIDNIRRKFLHEQRIDFTHRSSSDVASAKIGSLPREHIGISPGIEIPLE